MSIEAKIILDSVSPEGARLTTMEVTFHRFILSEFNTHRVFSRNSASSRAIPTFKLLEKVLLNPAMPVSFGVNQSGMQAEEELEGDARLEAEEVWLEAAQDAVSAAQALSELGVHKQVTNRLLEPFMWHTAIVTATDFSNFFAQRNNDDAQPEIHILADLMQTVYEASEPDLVEEGGWHMPYLRLEDYSLEPKEQVAVSAARCARVSYLTHDGKRSVDKDLELYERLATAQPPHWSPMEHVATPRGPEHSYGMLGNFDGWEQLRHYGEAL